ncbi:calmodulin-A-like [Ruditapes philippinarum]|uniref:calmodulin-A-like n=1 Tax=Ruditapes philippinarum TaxID=129788 RepID=UPI00295B7D1E|nr:calmodulin-A-like [Ruditapes philippinarum]
MSAEGELSFWLKRQLTAFEEKFCEADKDKNGSLSFAEISEVLRNSGFKGTEEDVKAIFKFADSNKDAKISRNEYMVAVKKAPKTSLKEIVLRRAFKKYDKDGSGFLSRDEVISAVGSEEAGLNLPAEKVSEMLISLVHEKGKGDQQVSYEEFLQVFHYNQTATLLRELFNNIDKDKSGFLTKKEIIDAIKADEELSFKAANLSQLLITFSKDKMDKINYEEFAKIVANQAKK